MRFLSTIIVVCQDRAFETVISNNALSITSVHPCVHRTCARYFLRYETRDALLHHRRDHDYVY